jgi:hypothetical protein
MRIRNTDYSIAIELQQHNHSIAQYHIGSTRITAIITTAQLYIALKEQSRSITINTSIDRKYIHRTTAQPKHQYYQITDPKAGKNIF